MARIATTMSLRSYQVRDLRITGGCSSETRGFKITRSPAGRLVVMDLGFFSLKRFRALKRVRSRAALLRPGGKRLRVGSAPSSRRFTENDS